ncbi:MarR family winged helix-turn-helix transcriptional regulator [Variovorax sp. HJSM1_2]|uniref:MarR family winged helix-turn-helix transcriptional regulator n=1 Tax=Variovorax sp. HJSM1_2 TaxID=3366263 RepID=UPI003BDDF159
MTRVKLPHTAAPAADASVFFKLVRVVNLTARPFQESVGRQYQLTLNEWRVLAVLAVLAQHADVTAMAVADLTGLDKMSVSRALRGLARRGRLQTQTLESDLRKRQLQVTPAGRALFMEVWPLAQQREAALFADLPAAELAQLGAVLDKLVVSVRSQR